MEFLPNDAKTYSAFCRFNEDLHKNRKWYVQQIAVALQFLISVFITLSSATCSQPLWEEAFTYSVLLTETCTGFLCMKTFSCMQMSVAVIWIFSLATVTDSSQCCQPLAGAAAGLAHAINNGLWFVFSSFVQKILMQSYHTDMTYIVVVGGNNLMGNIKITALLLWQSHSNIMWKRFESNCFNII